MINPIPDKPTWPKGTRATLAPQRITPAVTVAFESFDFLGPNFRWIDNPNAQTLSAQGIGGQTVVVMGAQARTAYNPAWQEQDARAALLAQLQLTVPA